MLTKKYLLASFFSLLLTATMCVPAVLAIGDKVPLKLLQPDVIVDTEEQADRTAEGYGNDTNETTMTQIVADILGVFFGLLGTIFVVLMVLGGYHWMTAAGRAEKVEKAQHTIKVAIIGIIIIASAYAITYWVFARLPDASR